LRPSKNILYVAGPGLEKAKKPEEPHDSTVQTVLRGVMRAQALVRGVRGRVAYRRRVEHKASQSNGMLSFQEVYQNNLYVKRLLVANRSQLVNIFEAFVDNNQNVLSRDGFTRLGAAFHIAPLICTRRKLDVFLMRVKDISTVPELPGLSFVDFMKLLVLVALEGNSDSSDADTATPETKLSRVLEVLDSTDGKAKASLLRNQKLIGSFKLAKASLPNLLAVDQYDLRRGASKKKRVKRAKGRTSSSTMYTSSPRSDGFSDTLSDIGAQMDRLAPGRTLSPMRGNASSGKRRVKPVSRVKSTGKGERNDLYDDFMEKTVNRDTPTRGTPTRGPTSPLSLYSDDGVAYTEF